MQFFSPHHRSRTMGMALIVGLSFWMPRTVVQAQTEDPQRIRIAVETLSRLQNVDLEKNPKLKATVLKVLAATAGTRDYVALIKQFNLAGQEEGLIQYAILHPEEETGVEAMRMVLSSDDNSALRSALNGDDNNLTNAIHVVQALGNTKDSRAIPYLLPLIEKDNHAIALRKKAVPALARTEAGAQQLLKLAREERLADELKFTTSAELAAVRWPDIQTEAATLLPLPPGQNAEPLPPLSTLLKMKGDPTRGRAVFQRELSQCSACHRVLGAGKEVGPDLSEIGTKLGKDALYEAILDPSAGVSFGYEAFELELKSGDEAFGLIVSETAEELAIKDTQGIITRYPKSNLLSRRQMKLSIMPTGLQLTMSTQELVDLVEYLSSLKKN